MPCSSLPFSFKKSFDGCVTTSISGPTDVWVDILKDVVGTNFVVDDNGAKASVQGSKVAAAAITFMILGPLECGYFETNLIGR